MSVYLWLAIHVLFIASTYLVRLFIHLARRESRHPINTLTIATRFFIAPFHAFCGAFCAIAGGAMGAMQVKQTS